MAFAHMGHASSARARWRLISRLTALSLMLALPTHSAAAQSESAVSAAMDRQISRARALVESGEGAEARNLLDSLVQAAPSASFDLAEALFWRAVLAERMAEAERDWKRLVIEAPLSPRAADALVRLGELDLLRGRPAESRVYLERVIREFPTGVQRTKSALLVARSYFDERNDVSGCATLEELQASGIPDGELRMQATDLARRCANVKAVAEKDAGKAEASKVEASKAEAARPAAAKAETAASPAANVPANARFSVQLAAFDTQREADAAVARLAKAGVKARVDGTSKPFRVRTGYFATRAQANTELARLKKGGHNGFVAELPTGSSR